MKGLILVFLVIVLASIAYAVPPGMTVHFDNGNVTFDGAKHAEAGLKCQDCHPSPFPYQKGAVKITLKDHVPGKMCGTCHDGKKAFAIKSGNCTRCHKLPEGAVK